MRVWVYVEGESDRLALYALWAPWRESLRRARHGIQIIALGSKARLLGKLGPYAAVRLVEHDADLVVGMPDLYPNADFTNTPFKHDNLEDLLRIQTREVEKGLRDTQGVREGEIDGVLARFLPSALKHDLEMLLLAARDQLRACLGTSERLARWRQPVEDQNQDRPPKRIIEELFRTKTLKKRSYRDTKDAPAVLRSVDDIRTLLYFGTNQVNCPVFKTMLDWVGERTGVPAYD